MRAATPTNERFLDSNNSNSSDPPVDLDVHGPASSDGAGVGDLESQAAAGQEPSVVADGAVNEAANAGAGGGGGYVSGEQLKEARRRRYNLIILAVSVTAIVIVGVTLGLYFGLRSSGNDGASPINSPDNPIVKFTILHLNDLYELDGVQGGREGGVPRVQTLMNELRDENPAFKSVLAGDTFSPSAIGAVQLPPDNRRIAGRHMVDVLNMVEWDYFTFGNHEFDYARSYFDERLEQAEFTIFSSNVFDNEAPDNGTRFAHTENTVTWDLFGLKIGFVGLCLKTNMEDPWALFEDPTEVAEREVKRLKDEGHDVIVLVTHQARFDDHNVTALRVPDVDIIMGGHEHENSHDAHTGFPDTFKADANARSAYIHRFTFNKTDKTLAIESEFKEINEDTLENDAAVYDRVSEWIDLAFSNLTVGGLPADQAIVILNETLDGREAIIRNTNGTLSNLVLAGMDGDDAFNDTTIAIINGGAIRIDDTIAPGPLTGLDILRIMPFGGEARRVAMNGSTLVAALEQGARNAGSGAFLHASGVAKNAATGQWEHLATGEAIDVDAATSYAVSIGSYLFEVGDSNLDMLKESEGQVVAPPGYDKPALWELFASALMKSYPSPPEETLREYRDYLKSWVEHMDHARELGLQNAAEAGGREATRRAAPSAGDDHNLLKLIESRRRLHSEL